MKVAKEINGLSHDIVIDPRGRFQLTGGLDKVHKDLDFFIGFDMPRYYEWEYPTILKRLIQYTVWEFKQYAQLLRISLLKKMRKYFPYLVIPAIEIDYKPRERRSILLSIIYNIISTKVYVYYTHES